MVKPHDQRGQRQAIMSTSRESAAIEHAAGGSPAERVSFGRYLQIFRLERDISLELVAEETRIAVGMLEAIEHEDFSRLPPEVFTKGFLRAYAEAVGADGSEAVRRFDAHRAMIERTGDIRREPARASQGLWGKLLLSLALLIALIAGSILGYQHWAPRPDDSPASTPHQVPAGVSPPASSPASQPPSEASKKAMIPAAPKHVLTISAHEDSWVKVVIDQGTPAEHKLKAGNQIKLEAQNSFNLLIGNAGGIRLTLNNKPLPAPGKRDEVVNLSLP